MFLSIDFEELTIDRLIDTGALNSVIYSHLNKIRTFVKLLSVIDADPAPNFPIMIAIGRAWKSYCYQLKFGLKLLISNSGNVP